MKRRIGITLFLIFILGFTTHAQEDCRLYFPDTHGSVREMKFYDQRDRLQTITRHEVLEKIVSGNIVTVKVRATSFDDSEKEIYTGDLEFICEDGIFRFDLKDYLDPAQLGSYEEMGVDITADNLAYPSVLNSNDQLPDGSIQMVVKSGGATIVTITMNITNRIVEGMETITTEAGTFNCYKINYDISSRVGFINTNASATEWIAESVGLVRSENYNRRGRLTGYSVLTNLK